MLLSCAIDDIRLFYYAAVGMQILAFWQKVSVGSLILRWPLKHVGFLLF